MKLATLRTHPAPDSPTVAVRLEGEIGSTGVGVGTATEVTGFADVGALLATPGWRDLAAAASGAVHDLAGIEPARWAPVVPRPGKIVCVGLNYATHIEEMGRVLPEHPTLFAKFAEALVGPFDEIELPAISTQPDWEAELAVIIGAPARRVDEAGAQECIAGYAVLNDVSMRDFQNRTLQWLQGKTFENSTPFGPYLVTADEWMPGPTMRAIVDGEVVQEAPTSDLVFSAPRLVSYLSDIVTLQPGDVISTGTTGGVGHARTPARYLVDGSVLVTEIDGLGAQRNVARAV